MFALTLMQELYNSEHMDKRPTRRDCCHIQYLVYLSNYIEVIVTDQFPRFVCTIEARIPRAKPEG